MSSPNYPERYPDDLERTEMIQVEKGKVLRLEFTQFKVYYHCRDYVQITDGNGTALMGKSCGHSTASPMSWVHFTPPIVTTLTNMVDVYFYTDYRYNDYGWSLNWTAVTPGLISKTSLSLHC